LAFMGGDYRLSGVARMHERPIGDLVDALRQAGAQIDYLGQEGYPPLAIGQGRIHAEESIRIKGSVSGQFLTALLLAAPLHTGASKRPYLVEVEGGRIPGRYILITGNRIARFGVGVRREGWERFVVPADAAYWSPGTMAIEGDPPSASYF